MLRDSLAIVPNGSSASSVAVAPLRPAAPFGQIIRQKEPENFEFLFPTLSTFAGGKKLRGLRKGLRKRDTHQYDRE